MIYRLISKQLWFRKQLHALDEGAFRKIEQIKVFVGVIHDYISVWCNGNVSRFTLQEWQLYWTEMLLLTCCPFKHKDSWKEPFRRQLERIITEAIQPVCFCSEMKRKMLPSEIAVTWNQCLLKMFPVNLLGMIKQNSIPYHHFLIRVEDGFDNDKSGGAPAARADQDSLRARSPRPHKVLPQKRIKNEINRALSVFTKWKISSWIFM